jgi:glycosyltransferase involved in cell wall biosynthesis
MRIVHVTSAHSPFDTRIFHKECRTLVKAGHEVVLIAPHDRDEIVDGVCIQAIPSPKGRRDRMIHTVRAAYQAAVDRGADVYHFHDPELIPIAVLLKLQGKRLVYDVHEDVPKQILTKPWIAPWVRAIVAKGVALVEDISVRLFDGIAAATPAIARRFPTEKTFIVQNFPILEELGTLDIQPHANSPLDVVYVGGITEIRGIREMVQAMALLPERLDARLIVAGRFVPADLECAVRSVPGWTRVDFLGWQSRSQVTALLRQVRAGLVLFHPAPNHVDAQPTKLFEYMSAGIPVIISDFPLWREIVEGAGCGLLVDPLDPIAIARAIQWMLERPEEAEAMGRCGQRAVYRRYNWELESKNLLTLYEDVSK